MSLISYTNINYIQKLHAITTLNNSLHNMSKFNHPQPSKINSVVNTKPVKKPTVKPAVKPAVSAINKTTPYYTKKTTYNSIIPLKIYQTWYTKDLPDKMKERVELLKVNNPEFEHCLFDDNDCREFIKNNYDANVLYAYDHLVPGAYKADLWRLCVLYKNGGIYMDIKLSCINNFKLIELSETEHFVLDRVGPLSIYNALLVCKRDNPFLWRGICRIAANVRHRIYGKTPLDPTGPRLLGDIILRNNLKLNTDLIHYTHGGYILYNGHFVISTDYSEYKNERTKIYNKINLKRYDKMWHERRIYK
jgi:mannosyltransferase OCH1-like enzyme